jgi:hypothetical protein
MSLGDRCDEIVRLIDETLAAVAAEPSAHPVELDAAAPRLPRLSAVDGSSVKAMAPVTAPALDSGAGGAGPGWLRPFTRWPLAWLRPDPDDTADPDGHRVASGF